jgi:enoyl-CoA hydratase
VSRVVPVADLDAVVHDAAVQIAKAPKVTVKMAREVIRHLSLPQLRTSMNDEMIYQTTINKSDDFAELRAARADERPPRFTGS